MADEARKAAITRLNTWNENMGTFNKRALKVKRDETT